MVRTPAFHVGNAEFESPWGHHLFKHKERKMKAEKTERGFKYISHPSYPENEDKRILQESSAIGDYEDSFEKPGSSFLWIGDNFHLNREEVAELIGNLQFWLDNKRIKNEL